MANRGLFGTIEDTMTSPLWLGGAALLTGEGMSGAMQGLRMGAGFRQQRRQQQEEEERKRRFQGLVSDPSQMQGINPALLRVAQAAGPEQGWRILADAYGRMPTEDDRRFMQARAGLVNAQTEAARAQAGLYRHRAMQPTQADAKAAEKAAQRDKLRASISGGIDQLARLPEEYGGDSGTFGSAVGTFRGSDDLSFGLGPLGRLWGSVSSLVQDTDGSPTEVRAKLAGDTEALAAAIKPLIRAPGEGPWTDKDQERLVAVVGNLATANNVEEYKRRLEGVRERVMANFGIDLPPINWPRRRERASGAGANNVRDMSDDELLSILGGQ